MPKTPPVQNSPGWFLEGHLEKGGSVWRVPIQPLPFRIGRRQGLELTLLSKSVSSVHAELRLEPEALRVRDLGSTNGTFVNRVRVGDAPLREGDVVHFADIEFRVGREARSDALPRLLTLPLDGLELPEGFIERGQQLMALLERGVVRVVFQPIVSLQQQGVLGHEALGRGHHPDLPENPIDLFRLAANLGVEVALSRLFRSKLRELANAPHKPLGTLFLNTHPDEVFDPETLRSLSELRELLPALPLALEINETAITSAEEMRELRQQLDALDIRLAFDDFGVGQARFMELGEQPPSFLKFDKSLIRDIDKAPAARQRMLVSLVSMARELGASTIAEGVETAAEADWCQQAGFTHAQGFFYCRPLPVEDL